MILSLLFPFKCACPLSVPTPKAVIVSSLERRCNDGRRKSNGISDLTVRNAITMAGRSLEAFKTCWRP
jgi:hypothetical protein